MNKKYIVFLLLTLLVFLSSCKYGDVSKSCKDFDGSWSSIHKEFEQISGDQCEELGGTFNGCASPCRHNPLSKICTMNCVQLCSFEVEEKGKYKK